MPDESLDLLELICLRKSAMNERLNTPKTAIIQSYVDEQGISVCRRISKMNYHTSMDDVICRWTPVDRRVSLFGVDQVCV